MTLSIPDKAKVNAKAYNRLCFPGKLKNDATMRTVISAVCIMVCNFWG